MKKIIALVCAIAIIASMGLVASFAAAPTGFASSRAEFREIYTQWGADGVLGSWGGGDDIGDKGSVCTAADQELNFRALVAWADGVRTFPKISKVGYVIEGTTNIVWISDATIRNAEEGESIAFCANPAPYSWGGTVISFDLDTSTLPAGTWNIYFVFEYDGNVYMLPENSASYVNTGSPVWPYTTVISSGANYVEPSAEDDTKLDDIALNVYGQKVTAEIGITADDASKYAVVIGDAEAVYNGYTGKFVSPAIDLNWLDETFTISLYDATSEDLLDEVEWSPADYLRATEGPLGKNILALGSALDIYNGGDGFGEIEGADVAPDTFNTTLTDVESWRASKDDYIKSAVLAVNDGINIIYKMKVTDAVSGYMESTNNALYVESFDIEINSDVVGCNAYFATGDICIADLASETTLRILDGESNELSSIANYSVLHYIKANYNSNNVALRNVVRALYSAYLSTMPLDY